MNSIGYSRMRTISNRHQWYIESFCKVLLDQKEALAALQAKTKPRGKGRPSKAAKIGDIADTAVPLSVDDEDMDEPTAASAEPPTKKTKTDASTAAASSIAPSPPPLAVPAAALSIAEASSSVASSSSGALMAVKSGPPVKAIRHMLRLAAVPIVHINREKNGQRKGLKGEEREIGGFGGEEHAHARTHTHSRTQARTHVRTHTHTAGMHAHARTLARTLPHTQACSNARTHMYPRAHAHTNSH